MLKLYEIEQTFNDKTIANLKDVIQREINANDSVRSLQKGSEIAITAGSRGICNIVAILREVVTTLKDLELKPFVVPAMGSHGGATAEGQVTVLEHLGITEESIGAPIQSSMEVVKVGETINKLPVYMDKIAYNAAGIIVINRIKSHTAFQGKVESGLSKMVTIGLGKRKGASFVHSQGVGDMANNIMEVAKFSLEHSPILMGLAIVENGYDETAEIIGVSKEDWFEKEAELLSVSKSMMPSLPINNIDLLIVEEMGKCFSGTGMDPVIIGRWRIVGVTEPENPKVKRIVVLDLAEKSFGNAQGMGLADFITEKYFKKIDRQATYMNAMTSTFLSRAMTPFIYNDEKEAIDAAIYSLGPEVDLNTLKIVQIPNTLHLKNVYVSASALEELKSSNRKYKIVGEVMLKFSEQGELTQKLHG